MLKWEKVAKSFLPVHWCGSLEWPFKKFLTLLVPYDSWNSDLVVFSDRGRRADEGHLRGRQVPARHEHCAQRSKARKSALLTER